MITKGEAARLVLPHGTTYDCAVPQSWVEDIAMNARNARLSSSEIAGQFVWAYPTGGVFGIPVPLTFEALIALKRVDMNLYNAARDLCPGLPGKCMKVTVLSKEGR